ncbi:hypothetical protein Tco_0125716 [Tanacetum coccineum]
MPRVGIPRPPRASMQDLYDMVGHMEIRQDAIEQMEYRKSYHWDRYHGVFEHMAGGSNSSDGGNIGDGVKKAGGVIRSGGGIEFSEELKELLSDEDEK